MTILKDLPERKRKILSGRSFYPCYFIRTLAIAFPGRTVVFITPDLEHILVILDGQHRWEAIKELKKAGEDYEAYFILPLTDQYDLMTILKEANTSVNPWIGNAS